MRNLVLAAALLTATLAPGSGAADSPQIDCPPRVHPNPAPNEVCGQDRYPSKAARDRCAYADRVAQMKQQERDYCEMKARVEAAEGAHQPAAEPGPSNTQP